MEQINTDQEHVNRRAWLVEAIQATGLADRQVQEEFHEWVRVEESQRGDSFSSAIEVTIRRALLCKDAGLIELSRELLEDAYEDAYKSLGDDDLCARIDGIINSLD